MLLQKKYPNVKGINLAKNFGQHNAIMAGMNYAQGELILGMDDDMQNHPSQIPQFLDKMEEGYDIVFGVFKQRKFSWFKNLTGAVSRFSFVASAGPSEGYPDEQFLVLQKVCKRRGCQIRRL